jgi:hypothetical protein
MNFKKKEKQEPIIADKSNKYLIYLNMKDFIFYHVIIFIFFKFDFKNYNMNPKLNK